MSDVAAVGILLFSLPFLGVGLFVLSLSATFFYRAGGRLLTTVHSSVTEPVGPADLPESGHAVVTGTVDPGPDGLLTTPFSGSEAVAYRYGMEQRSDGVGWWDVVDGEHAGPFVIEGAVDRVRVDPGDRDLGLDRGTASTVGPDEELPDGARQSLRESGAVDDDDLPKLRAAAVDEPRRYAERTVDPGERLYVYGKITDGGAHGRQIDGDASRGFRLARESPEGITDDDTDEARSIAGQLAIGLFTLLFGGAFTAVGGFAFLLGVRTVLGL